MASSGLSDRAFPKQKPPYSVNPRSAPWRVRSLWLIGLGLVCALSAGLQAAPEQVSREVLHLPNVVQILGRVPLEDGAFADVLNANARVMAARGEPVEPYRLTLQRLGLDPTAMDKVGDGSCMRFRYVRYRLNEDFDLILFLASASTEDRRRRILFARRLVVLPHFEGDLLEVAERPVGFVRGRLVERPEFEME